MKQPTARQLAIYDFIVEYRRENRYSPTVREIGKAFGIGSLRGVTVHLEALSKKGLLLLNPGVTRGLVPKKIAEGPSRTPGVLRIVSKGTAIETKVYSPEGEDITGTVHDIEIRIVAGMPTLAKLTVWAEVQVEVEKKNVKVERYHIGNDKVI